MFKILSMKHLNETIFEMVVEAPMVARSCQPGQFIIVRSDEEGERIPLTICDYDREKGSVTIVVQVIGAGTMKMSKMKEGDFLADFVGPLGQPSDLVTDDIEEVKKKTSDKVMDRYDVLIFPKDKIWEDGENEYEYLKKKFEEVRRD